MHLKTKYIFIQSVIFKCTKKNFEINGITTKPNIAPPFERNAVHIIGKKHEE